MSIHLHPLDGRWQMVRAELAGEPAPELVIAKTELILANGTYEVRFDGQAMDRGTFEAAVQGQLKTLVLHGTTGTNAGRIIPCIYQLQGDRLRVCYGLDGIQPRSFVSTSITTRYLASYARRSS